jgi:hypothetical protein
VVSFSFHFLYFLFFSLFFIVYVFVSFLLFNFSSFFPFELFPSLHMAAVSGVFIGYFPTSCCLQRLGLRVFAQYVFPGPCGRLHHLVSFKPIEETAQVRIICYVCPLGRITEKCKLSKISKSLLFSEEPLGRIGLPWHSLIFNHRGGCSRPFHPRL